MSLGEDVIRIIENSPLYLAISDFHGGLFPALLVGDGNNGTFAGCPLWLGGAGYVGYHVALSIGTLEWKYMEKPYGPERSLAIGEIELHHESVTSFCLYSKKNPSQSRTLILHATRKTLLPELSYDSVAWERYMEIGTEWRETGQQRSVL